MREVKVPKAIDKEAMTSKGHSARLSESPTMPLVAGVKVTYDTSMWRCALPTCISSSSWRSSPSRMCVAIKMLLHCQYLNNISIN